MHIPAFPLPSQMTKVIYFRVPTVADGLLFCEQDTDLEEATTTQYLNHLQDTSKGAISDAGEWTGEDRRTALWWIFISTTELGTIPFSYQCVHCKETHYLDLNMAELMETAKAVPQLPVIDIEFNAQGQTMKGQVKPMNGYAVEHIEGLRNHRDQFSEESAEYKQADNEITLNELAHCLSIEGQPQDNNEALTWKMDLIKGMHLRTEFTKLSVLVEQGIRIQRHGLLSKYYKGRYYLVTTIPECEAHIKKGGEATRSLLLPFRSHELIAAF